MKNILIDPDGANLLLGQGTRYPLTALSGFSKPPIRTSAGNFSGRDGGYVSGQNYSMRVMDVAGEVNGLTCQDTEDLRKAIADLPIRETLPVFVTTFAGNLYYTEAVVYDAKAETEGGTFGAYKILLTAPDPYFYLASVSDPDSVYFDQDFFRVSGGGYVTPYILPIVWSPGDTPTTISNSGTIVVYPEIILNGQYTNPKITNVTSGQFIELNVTTTVGDEIVIDMKNHTVTLNGGSIAAYVTDESNWWYLSVGNNTILLESDSGADNDTGIIRYRVGIEGL